MIFGARLYARCLISLLLRFLDENLDLSQKVCSAESFYSFFGLCGEFVLKESIAFRISSVMLYCTERQIM